jgi:beta-glucosidase
MKGYVDGLWPPEIKGDIKKALQAQKQMAQAHILAAREIRKFGFPGLNLGIAQHWRVFQPKSKSFLDRRVRDFLDFAFNRYFINILIYGNPYSNFLGFFHQEKVLDFIGINYYGRTIASFVGGPQFYKAEEGPGPKSDNGWEMYPEGMNLALKEVSKFGFPILITENGVADKADKFRPVFLRDHIASLMKAKNEGVDVIGYIHWSLTDNFEWKDGRATRFGLVEFNYDTQTRVPRPSFNIYKDIIKSYRNKL